jgi:hypothetical protein
MEKNSTAISRIDNILEQMKSPTQYGTELTTRKLDTIATAELGYLLNIMYQQWEIIEIASHTSKDNARHNYERAMNTIREILIVIIDEGHKTHSRSVAERGEYYRALAQRASALNNIWHSTINHSTPNEPPPNAYYTEEYMARRNANNADKALNTLRETNATNIITLWEAGLRKSVAEANKETLDDCIINIAQTSNPSTEATSASKRAAIAASALEKEIIPNLAASQEQLKNIVEATAKLIEKREFQLTSESLTHTGNDILKLMKTPSGVNLDGKEASREADNVVEQIKAYNEISGPEVDFADIDAEGYISKIVKGGK